LRGTLVELHDGRIHKLLELTTAHVPRPSDVEDQPRERTRLALHREASEFLQCLHGVGVREHRNALVLRLDRYICTSLADIEVQIAVDVSDVQKLLDEIRSNGAFI